MKNPIYSFVHDGLWITSFPLECSIDVVVDGIVTKTYPVTTGVPQGAILLPTLLLLYINDM